MQEFDLKEAAVYFKQRRINLGLSLRDAEGLSGMSHSNIRRFENKQQSIRVDNLLALAGAYKISFRVIEREEKND